MRLWPIPLIVGVIPVVTVNVAYLISLYHGTAVACMPYLEGCLTVSAASRTEPAIFFFRAVMMPATLLFVIYWAVSWTWLGRIDTSRQRHAIFLLGVVGALAMILYVDYLGTEGEMYRALRKYGTILFFGLTFLAQLMELGRMVRKNVGPAWAVSAKRIISYALLLGGLAFIPVQNAWDVDPIENIIEWNFSLLMMAHFMFTAAIWRRAEVEVRLVSKS